MFGNKMASAGVQATSKETRHDEVYEGTYTVEVNESEVGKYLHEEVNEVP
jgi:hypothetical protein